MGHTSAMPFRDPPTVLLVEDDLDVVTLMRDFLHAEGFGVSHAVDRLDALDAMCGRVDCVLLDVMLPGDSGFEICRLIRERSAVPILFLTAREADIDKLRGFGLGADDYVGKSATPAEVVARIKAVLRRSSPTSGARERLRFDGLEIDLAAREITVAGQVVKTTAREFDVLRLLTENPRQVFSRDRLFELVWGDYGDRTAVTVYIRRLREKIEADPAHPRLITTVWGIGYRFDGELA